MKDSEYFETMLRLALGVETILEEMNEAFNECDNGERLSKEITDKFKKLHNKTLEQRKLLPESNIIPIECALLLDLRNAIEFICKKKYVTEHDKALMLDICKHIHRIFKNI
jgi:hypothetical protein